MSVKMFKCSTGDFIISEVSNETETSMTLKSPMQVFFRPEPSGQLGLNLYPFHPFASSVNEEIPIDKRYHILFFVSAIPENLESEYNRITSGIVTAKSIPNLTLAKK